MKAQTTLHRVIFGLAAAALVCAGIALPVSCENDLTPESPKEPPQSTLPLTGDISFLKTVDNSSETDFDLTQSLGNGTAWELSAVEAATTWFMVSKSAAQTITVSGTDAAKVTQHTEGEHDGGAADAELTIFEVDTGDTIFEGGTRQFTLTVEEAEKAPKMVTVNLTVKPNLTGIAVFRVVRENDPRPAEPVFESGIPENAESRAVNAEMEAWAKRGKLERIEGIQRWDNAGKDWEPETRGDTFLDAIAWLDQNGQSDNEYLIRIDKERIHTSLAFKLS